MFDVGLWELVLIFGVGLMILGPERMPRVAAQIGRWVRSARRTAMQLWRQLERELELDERINPRSKPHRKPPTPPAGPQRQEDGTFPDKESKAEASPKSSTSEGSPDQGSPSEPATEQVSPESE